MKFILVLALILVSQVVGFSSFQKGSIGIPSKISTRKFLFGNSEPSKNVPEKKADGGMFGGNWYNFVL